MAEVKPAEVSAILRKQLSGFKSESQLEEVGTVLQVGRWNCKNLWTHQCTIRRID